MLDEDQIQEMADKACDAARKPSKYCGMTYEEGVRDALDWVLENNEDAPIEE